MNNIFLIALIGAFAGLHSACWGLYKDSPYEKAYLRKFVRSIVMGFTVALVFDYLLIHLGILNYNLGIFFGVCVVFERLITEIYKGFFREESQKRYKIPSLFHIGKFIVKDVLFKESIGAALLIFIISLFLFFSDLRLDSLGIPHVVLGGLFGLIMGILEAAGGAEKDAPFEGFEPLKVFRSPTVDLIWGIILSFFSPNYGLIFLATGGAGRMTIELYKTFIVKKVPGKFRAAEPPFKAWLQKRRIVVFPYFLTWVVFIALLATKFIRS